MSLAKITIPLDADTARIFTDAPADEQKKMRLLLSFWLREFAASPSPLNVLMDDLSAKAQARGLTPEILETLLNAE
ncbi:MAG: hypothetical protein HZC40_01820 [Chloroflexi bacterium]|nr:hypothetical protein [Chloroflexota bacterium]